MNILDQIFYQLARDLSITNNLNLQMVQCSFSITGVTNFYSSKVHTSSGANPASSGVALSIHLHLV